MAAQKSPKYGLIRNGRGWVKRVGKTPKWIVSARLCPSGEEADEYYEKNFTAIAQAKPKPKPSSLTVKDVCNLFIQHKESRGLHGKTIVDYDDTNMRIMRAAGADKPFADLDAGDAAALEDGLVKLGTNRKTKHAIQVRGLIRWCGKKGIPCGWKIEMFVPPSKAERRRDRAKRIRRPYTPNEMRRLFRHASDRLRAMMLLSLNAAMGPDELLTVTRSDIRKGVLEKPRQKTGIDRRVPLWPETMAALKPYGPGNLFPGTKPGTLMAKFKNLCGRSAVPPRGLYTMRRTFRTIADGYGDQRAAALVMGRELPDIDTVYVLKVEDDRIVRMLDHVKSVLRIGRALVAKRYTQGQRSLAKRIARRKSRLDGQSSRKGGTADTSTGHQPFGRG